MTGMAVLLLAASSGLTLHLSPEASEILVGEPLRLELTWHAERRLQIPSEAVAGGWNYDYLQIWVNGPTGRHEYREIPPMIEERVITTDPLDAGDEVVSDLVLLYGLHAMKAEGYLFPRPGAYTLMVRYADSKNPADSDTISVRVGQPKGDEQAVFDALKTDPNEIKLGGPKARRLAAKNPRSRYLRPATVARYRQKESRLRDHRDPETGGPLNMSPDQWDLFAVDAYRRMAGELEEADSWGPYEDVRLAMLAEYAKRGGNAEEAEQAEKEVLSRFPRSRVAEAIRSAEAREKRADGDATPWSGYGVSYKVGDLVSHDGLTWKCIKAHRSQVTMSPPNAPSLWVGVPDDEE